MRYLELLPVIHYEIYYYYNLKDKNKDLNRAAILEIAKKHSEDMIPESEQEFINKVVKDYAIFLDPDQLQIE